MTKKTIILEVTEGHICCEACENTIKRTVGQMPGVAEVLPSHESQQVKVTLDTNEVTVTAVQETLSKIGWQTEEA
ncbi:MAG: heavy-metal-associated domain-containing protein [Anaerolineae bacterium]